MKIKLISSEEYKELVDIQEKYPNLTFQNAGYEYIDISRLSDEDKIAYKKVSDILSKSIVGFVEFNNFRVKENTKEVVVRFQYNYEAELAPEYRKTGFVGVGYLSLKQLLNGFDEK